MSKSSIYLTIFSSVLFFGYSLSFALSNYESVSKKVSEFRSLVLIESHSEQLRKTNFLFSLFFSLVYLSILYFTGYVFWFLGLVLLKLVLSLCFSDYFQKLVLKKEGSLSKRFYVFMKTDSFVNAFLALFTPLIILL